jgi:SAM-dependent methyltransferase
MIEEKIFDLITAPWKTRVVFVAIRLKVFSLLSKKKATIDELSEVCKAVPSLLKAVMDVCLSMDLLEYRNSRYINSPLSEKYLVEGKPEYIGDLIQLQDDESEHWHKLIDLVMGRRERRTENERYRTFIRGMNNLGMLGEAEALASTVDLSGSRRMIDAGGGSGLYSRYFCRKYPQLFSTIMDRRETLDITREMIADYPEKERINLREGDILKDPFETDIDVFLMSDVIYDEEAARVVLKKAWDCLLENGLLVIRGYYSDPYNTNVLFGALFAIGQLVFDPSRKVMTVTDLQNAVKEAGFCIKKVSKLTDLSFVLIAKKNSKKHG